MTGWKLNGLEVNAQLTRWFVSFAELSCIDNWTYYSHIAKPPNPTNPARNLSGPNLAGFSKNGRIPDLPEPEPKSGTTLSKNVSLCFQIRHCVGVQGTQLRFFSLKRLPPGLLTNTKRTRKPSWRNGYARQLRHSKMAISRHLKYYPTGNSAIRSADPENPCVESNVEWIGCTVCEIFAIKLFCDLETGVWGHSRSLKAALFDRAHTTLYSSSIVTMPLSSTLFEI